MRVLLAVLLLLVSGPLGAEEPTEGERREAQGACRELQVRYALHRDAGELEAWLDLFTEDAVMSLAGRESRGRDALRAAAAQRMTGEALRHVVSNQSVEVESVDRARGRSYATVIGADAGVPAIRAVVEYWDRYQRTPRGWRIAERRTEIVFAAVPPPAPPEGGP
ncbi:MAG: hypothetical protein CL910_12035 [Deltaproteobacteria bacterium]|jgi:hypothetical protein|nr:hypothetical protein [Deltaproteobacteria bacterium]